MTLDAEMNRVGQEHVIVDAPEFENLQFEADNAYYDVLPDGEHFVMLLTPKYPSPTHYNVVVNWFEELRVPESGTGQQDFDPHPALRATLSQRERE